MAEDFDPEDIARIGSMRGLALRLADEARQHASENGEHGIAEAVQALFVAAGRLVAEFKEPGFGSLMGAGNLAAQTMATAMRERWMEMESERVN